MTVLLVITMIIVFLAIEVVYHKVSRKSTLKAAEPVKVSPAFSKYSTEEVLVPQSLFFGKGHTWVNLRNSGNVQIGIDDFARRFFGKVDKVYLKAVGENVKKGEPIFSVERDGKKLSFASPVSGSISGINEKTISNLDSLKTNPYENSWFITVKPTNLAADIKIMKVADEATKWIREEMTRLKDFIAGVHTEDALVGATLHDGGTPVEGVIEFIDKSSCEKFEKDFLSE